MASCRSSFQPTSPRHSWATPRIASAKAKGDPRNRSPFPASPSATSITIWASRRTSAISPTSCLADIAANDSAAVIVGSPMDSSSRTSSLARRDASRRSAFSHFAVTSPTMPIANDRRSPASMQRSRSSSKPVSVPPTPSRNAVPHNRARGEMRIDNRSGSSAGSSSATCRARRQLATAAPMSRLVAHVAARMCHANAAWRSPADSRCSAIRAAFSSTESGARCSIAPATRRCSSARSDLSCDSWATLRISGCRNAYSARGVNLT